MQDIEPTVTVVEEANDTAVRASRRVAAVIVATMSSDEESSDTTNLMMRRRRRPRRRLLYFVWLPLLVVVVVVLVGYVALSSRRNDGYYLSALRVQQRYVNRKNTTLHHHQPSSSSSSTTCSCFSNSETNMRRSSSISSSEQCCERIIFRTHKFGTILVGELFQQFRRYTTTTTTTGPTTNLQIRTKPTPKSSNYTLPVTNFSSDYRHVMVTRNWMDAIVSGYLYHKAGFECWIEYGGTEVRHSSHYDMELHYHNKYWDTQHLTYHVQYGIPFPARNNRSLCTYLQEESEEDGIKVIMDVALSRWYKGVVSYYEKVQAKLKDDQQERSLFLCYEDLVDPFQQEAIFYQVLNFMFPGRNMSGMHMPGPMKQSLIQQQESHAVYSGGHASTKDPKLRARLRTMVEQYDRELFHNVIATSNAIFGCGMDKT